MSPEEAARSDPHQADPEAVSGEVRATQMLLATADRDCLVVAACVTRGRRTNVTVSYGGEETLPLDRLVPLRNCVVQLISQLDDAIIQSMAGGGR